mmetsp:Transcript_20824/g.57898  ORF Transcript_20824/g.57898 Transcript_20824/m.57898 type:complete len:248 (-) Transcript_20824:145-888(-)
MIERSSSRNCSVRFSRKEEPTCRTNGSMPSILAFTITRCSTIATSWPHMNASHLLQTSTVLDRLPSDASPSLPALAADPQSKLSRLLPLSEIPPYRPALPPSKPTLSESRASFPNANSSAWANSEHISASCVSKTRIMFLFPIVPMALAVTCVSNVMTNSVGSVRSVWYRTPSYMLCNPPSITTGGVAILDVVVIGVIAVVVPASAMEDPLSSLRRVQVCDSMMAHSAGNAARLSVNGVTIRPDDPR